MQSPLALRRSLCFGRCPRITRTTIAMFPVGDSDEIAKVAPFLESDDSGFVTEIELFVGGRAQIKLISVFSVNVDLPRSRIELET
jgi:hypothetical protein